MSGIRRYYNDNGLMIRDEDAPWVPFTDHEQVVADLDERYRGYREAAIEETSRLRAEADSLRKDAERYRWLRDRSGSSVTTAEMQPAAWIEGPGNQFIESDWLTGERADHVIDEAMGAKA